MVLVLKLHFQLVQTIVKEKLVENSLSFLGFFDLDFNAFI